ncbi:MAG: aminoglycoside adenylyltransferase domain-containing protein [Chloroflexota bacterium]
MGADHVTQPTPYPDVNAVLRELLAAVQTILGDYFVGLYLYGSLSSGDFNPLSSDVDFLVVTTTALPGEVIAALEAMHTRLAAGGSKWAAKLEGSYIPQTALRRYDPAGPAYPTLNEGRFYLAPHASDWVIQRHVIRKQGVTVAGPPPKTLIDPIQPDELRAAVQGILRGWWSPMADTPGRLHSRGYQAYAILTMCRALYTLEYGEVVSKPAATRWAQQVLGERWGGLIEAAAHAWWHDTPFDRFGETVAFIRFAVECSQPLQTPIGEV